MYIRAIVGDYLTQLTHDLKDTTPTAGVEFHIDVTFYRLDVGATILQLIPPLFDVLRGRIWVSDSQVRSITIDIWDNFKQAGLGLSIREVP